MAFPPIEPFASGLLTVDHDTKIYWETSGRPDGIPTLYLHGGPGGSLRAGYRRYFDPEQMLIVGLDQRGCGRSTPRATDDLTNLSSNTTQALIADIEALRDHLGVDRWMVTGVSWGCTLALAYAQEHPERVSAIVLMAVTAGTRDEVDWITDGVGRIFPEAWAHFRAASGAVEGQRTVDAFATLITDEDSAVRNAATDAWMAWEDVHVSLDPARRANAQSYGRTDDADYRRNFATLVIHYWSHNLFLPESGVFGRMDRLAGIPGAMVHGRYDVSGPTQTAWRLQQTWPGSTLVVVEDEGHGGPGMVEEMARAISALADV